jgi:phage baseplate assembly protein V
MIYDADGDIGRNVMRRVEVIAVDDTGPIQKVTVMGLADEVFDLPLRGQGHGLTTVPPVGSIGYVMMAGGRPDQAFLMGLEHPEQRPNDRQPGESIMYATPGQRIVMDKDGNTAETAPGDRNLSSGGDQHVTSGGIIYVNC